MTQQQRISIATREFDQLIKLNPSLKTSIYTEDARFTLLHIKQIHYSKIYQERLQSTLKKLAGNKNRIQEKQGQYVELIHTMNDQHKKIIAFCLKNRDLIDCLYVEGLFYPANYERQVFHKQVNEPIQGVENIFKFSEPPCPVPDPPYFAGASYFLYHQHQLPVKGVEYGKLHRLTHQLYNDKKPRKNSLTDTLKVLHEERENKMLDHMSRNLDFNNKYDHSIKFLL